MIATKDIPQGFEKWNRQWGAPGGRTLPGPRLLRTHRFGRLFRGPFAAQANSETRRFEYPWAYFQLQTLGRCPLTIVEVGGGLSGLQFVLAREGHRVINVDPGAKEDTEWGFSPAAHAYCRDLFRSPVELIPARLEDAGLSPASADVVMSISVLEHLSDPDLISVAEGIKRVLKPEGIAVFTADLFLDVAPFTDDAAGRWGRNVNVRELLEQAGLELLKGARSELFGFPEFNPEAVRNNEDQLLVSRVRSTAQCFVARPRIAV